LGCIIKRRAAKKHVPALSKHVIQEGNKSMTKNIITYTKDVKSLWSGSNGIGVMKGNSLLIKGAGVKDFYSPSGLVRSFMYK
jgi:hypothetical protein